MDFLFATSYLLLIFTVYQVTPDLMAFKNNLSFLIVSWVSWVIFLGPVNFD